MERATKLNRRELVAGIATGLVVALVMGALMMIDADTATPRSIEGWAMPNANGTKISLHESPDHEQGEGYGIAGAMWADPAGPWRRWEEGPTCIGTDTSSMTHVELHVVTVQSDDLGTRPQVVSLRCLE